MGVKNCPETPRQKMINMMYLVLLAMMALNVASEVLDAFRVVDSSLVQTFKSLDAKNEQLYASFNQAYDLNQEKVRPWLEKSQQVKSSVDSLVKRIYDIKEELVMESGGTNLSGLTGYQIDPDRSYITNYDGDTLLIKKDDELNVPSEIMIRLNRAAELKENIIAVREELASLVDENSPVRGLILQELDTPDPRRTIKEGGENRTWESENFENKPLIACITLLSKLQIDIQNTESNVLNYLYGQIDASSFKFNKLGAVVIAQSSYVLEGDVYHAEVFLAAEDSTQQPEIFVNGSTLPIENGKGIYEVPASSQGLKTWSGEIHYLTPEGNVNVYPFESQYQVSVPSVTISPTKMNVFYMNIANPVRVSVPGIPSENLTVTMTNGTIQQEGGDYVVFPENEDLDGSDTKVNVTALMNGQSRFMGSMDFRVKRVPDPIATIAELNGGTLAKERLLAEQGIYADLKDFDFDLTFTVTSFDVTITGAGGYNTTWTSTSNRFTNDQRTQFGNLQTGSIIYFDNIMAHGEDNTDRELSPISFKIR